MKYVLAFWAIVGGALLVFGGLIASDAKGRMVLNVVKEPRLLTVIVGLPDVDDRYRWLSVHGCAAAVTESGAFCTGDFERESTQEIQGRKQYLIVWRDLPGGTMLLTAMAFDVNHRLLASQRLTVFRGF